MDELNTCPCNTCQLRLGYARAFDMHIWGDDCPYKCDVYDNWNHRAGERKEGADNDT